MDRQIDKLTGLINDLLNVARIRGGQLEYVDVAVDLNAVVREVVGDLQPTTTKHQIAVEGQIAGTVWGDRERLGQVVTNLLTNAIKYSPQADRVLVRLEQAKSGGRRSRCRTSGSGSTRSTGRISSRSSIGSVTPPRRPFRASASGSTLAARSSGGTGTIQIVSEIGVGTTFIVALPLYEDTTVAE